jgi:hypothetical protein
MSDLVQVEQDFTVPHHSASVDLHQRGEAVMAELVKLSESDCGVILDSAVSVDSGRNTVQLTVTVSAEELGEGVVQAITAMRTAIHAAGGATPEWPHNDELLEMVANTMRAEVRSA